MQEPRNFYLLTLFSMTGIVIGSQWSGGYLEKSPANHNVKTVVGHSTSLPCNLTSPVKGDKVRLVLWFKGKETKPVYSLDVRDRSYAEGRHWSDDSTMEGRAFFQVLGGTEGQLTIDSVQPYDEGIFKCRVDFKIQPTTISFVNLSVIIPPEKPKIYDNHHNEVRLKLGPYQLGQSVNIKCEVLGGRPSPEVTWWRDGHQILDQVQKSETGGQEFKVFNQLILSTLTREDLYSIFTCQASNNKEIPPVSTSVKLDMIFGPTSMKIRGDSIEKTLTAGKLLTFECEVVGARPQPTIKWFVGPSRTYIKQIGVKTINNGDVTVSTISLTPTPAMNGKQLTCRAASDTLPKDTMEDSIPLSVQYITAAHLSLGSSITDNWDEVKHGDDVYLDCGVVAYPPPHKITWHKDGIEVKQKLSRGIIHSNMSLVLQSVSRSNAGQYTCSATNSAGSVASNSLALHVKYVPECVPDQQTVYYVPLHQVAQVDCQVASEPGQEVTFQWMFNTSRETIDIQQSHSRSNASGQRSVVDYVPRTELDYGTLLCYGRNSIGLQEEPCVFHMRPAEKPRVVEDCKVIEQQLICTPGPTDSDLPQVFLLIVTLADNGHVVANLSHSDKPTFSLVGLLAESHQLNLTVTSSNSEGQSDPVSLMIQGTNIENNLITSESTADVNHLFQTGSLLSEHAITPILGALIGVGAALSLVTLILLLVLCTCRKKSGSNIQTHYSHKSGKEINMSGDEKDLITSNLLSPDIIPSQEGTQKSENSTLNNVYILDTSYSCHFPNRDVQQSTIMATSAYTNKTQPKPHYFDSHPSDCCYSCSSPTNVPSNYSTLQIRGLPDRNHDYSSLRQGQRQNNPSVRVPVILPPPSDSSVTSRELDSGCCGSREQTPLLLSPPCDSVSYSSSSSDRLNTSSGTTETVSGHVEVDYRAQMIDDRESKV